MKLHAGADLYRQAPLIVGDPDEQPPLPAIEHVIEYKNLVANRIELAEGSLDLLTLLGFNSRRYGFLAVAHGKGGGLADIDLHVSQMQQPADDIVDAARNLDFL